MNFRQGSETKAQKGTKNLKISGYQKYLSVNQGRQKTAKLNPNLTQTWPKARSSGVWAQRQQEQQEQRRKATTKISS